MEEEEKQSYKFGRLNGFSQVWKDTALTGENGLRAMNRLLLRSKRRRLLGGTAILLIAFSLGGLAIEEFKTLYFEARYFARFASTLSFSVEPGSNPSLRFPQQGPYDDRLGYTRLPDFLKGLNAQGYQVEEQARVSPGLSKVMDWELYPTYPEKNQAGLKISSQDDRSLFDAKRSWNGKNLRIPMCLISRASDRKENLWTGHNGITPSPERADR